MPLNVVIHTLGHVVNFPIDLLQKFTVLIVIPVVLTSGFLNQRHQHPARCQHSENNLQPAHVTPNDSLHIQCFDPLSWPNQ